MSILKIVFTAFQKGDVVKIQLTGLYMFKKAFHPTFVKEKR